MMERINCEEIIAEKIKTEMQIRPASESSFSYEELNTIIPEECPVVKLEEFHSVKDIKREETETTAGQFETVYIEPPILYENNRLQKSDQRLNISEVFSESIDDEPSLLLCRLCATQDNDMVDMFGTNELYKNIIKKIEVCLPIMVRETDTLPKQACQTCLEKLELCYQFRNSVAEAENQLLISSQEILGKLEETEEYCQASLLCNGHDSRETVNDNKEKETSLESKTSFEELLLTDTIVEDHIISSNSELHSNELFPIETRRSNNNNLDEDRRDNSDDDILFCGEESRVEAPAGQRAGAKFMKCIICGEAFSSDKIFQIHSGLHILNRYYPCSSCNEILRTKRQWRKHRLEHREKKKLRRIAVTESIDKSENEFITQLKLKFNKLYHKSSAETESISAEQIRTQEDPNAHETRTSRAVVCTLCKKRFRSDVLEAHKAECDKQLTTKKNVFSCAYCRKEFDRKFHLTVHIRSHTGEQPFSCNFCFQKFKHRRTRNFHLKLHRGERLFKCFTCKKTFPRVSELKGHAQVHNQQIRHAVCPICDQKFETTSLRNNHMAIHPGEKPCQCDFCGSYFRNKGALSRHMRTQHGPFGE